MPSKKEQQEIAHKTAGVPMPEDKTFGEEVKEVVQKVSSVVSGNCGHINKQHSNIDGELEGLPCTLTKGHAGDHSARVKALRANPYPVKNPKAEYLWRAGAEYEVVEVNTFWSDAAGTPADQIQPDYGGKTREEWVNERRAKALEEGKK